jgi:radical SAM protein with 4Fe4S-binding SPASM domain
VLLVLRALGLGDFLTAVPALRALADAFPDHRRLLAAPGVLEPLARLTGAVDGLVPAGPLEPIEGRTPRPAVGVNLHGRGPESHRLLLALQPGRLIAFAHPDVPESAGLPAWRADEPEVERWCRLLREVGIAADPARLDLAVPGPLPDVGLGATVIHPGSRHGARRWPVERWAAVARAERERGRRVIVTAGPGERPLADALARLAGLGPEAVAEPADLLELARLVTAAGRVLCSDTGVAHLATAVRTPSVVLFGPTSPALWGPPPDRPWHRVIWRGRRGNPHAERPDPGLLEIPVDEVLEALADLPAPGGPEAVPPQTPLRPPLPRELQLEVTGACNLRCHMCLVRYRPPLDRAVASVDFDRFRALVDGLPTLERLTLQGLGEPLMAPDLVRMVAYASARGIRVGFNTNATLLTRRTAEALVAAGLDWLHISLDGARAETYEAIRDGARFDKVCRHVSGLVEVMRERRAARPSLAVVFVAMRRNVRDLPDLVRLVAGWGIPQLRVQNLSHSFSDTDPAGAYREIRAFADSEALWSDAAGPGPTAAEVEDLFAEARRLGESLGVRVRVPELETSDEPPLPEVGCDWPWRSAYVRWDGRIQPCCMLMGGDRAVLGDLRDGFAAVWTGEPYVAFRRALLEHRPPAVCRGCAWYRGVF